MKKRVLTMVLALVLVLSLGTGAFALSAADFTDVESSDWYYEAVDYVATHGFMNGVSATEFAPKDYVNRAMVPTVLARVDGATVDNSAACRFADVASNLWYTGSVIWGDAKKIVQGDGTNFMPTNFVKREDVAVFVARYLDVAYYKSPNKDIIIFTDEDDIADYADAAVDLCTTTGIINGYPDGSFLPKQYMTRAEFAAVIMRLHIILTTPPVAAPAPVAGYRVIVDINAKPESASSTRNLNLRTQDYPVSGPAADVIDLAKDLTTSENGVAIVNAIDAVMKDLDGKTCSITVNSVYMDVSIAYVSDHIEISAVEHGTSTPVPLGNNFVKVLNDKYKDSATFADFVAKLGTYSVSLSTLAENKLKELYDACAPENFVVSVTTDVIQSLKASDYLTVISGIIDKADAFRTAYGADASQYYQARTVMIPQICAYYFNGFEVIMNGTSDEAFANDNFFAPFSGTVNNFIKFASSDTDVEKNSYAAIASRVNTYCGSEVVPSAFPFEQLLGDYSINVKVEAYY